MKLVLFLIGFLVAASQATPVGDEPQAAASAAAGTSLDSAEAIQPGELDDLTDIDLPSSSSAATGQSASSSGLDVLPFPLSVLVRLISKQALKAFDPGSVCDTVQFVDWKAYRDLLLKEDYSAFQKKLTQDEILSSLTETMQEYMLKYSKIISEGDTSVIEKNLKDFFNMFSLDKTSKSNSIDKTISDWMKLLASEKSVARNGFLAMQSYMKLMQETIQGRNLMNSLDFSQKDSFMKALSGKGV